MRVRKNLAMALIGLFLTGADCYQFRNGSVEFTGNGSFNVSSSDAYPDNIYTASLQPGISVYLSPNLYMGPLLSFQRTSEGNSSELTVMAAANLGVILNTGDSPADEGGAVFPYAGFAPGFQLQSWKSSFASYSSNGIVVSLYAGLKMAVAKNFFFNFQPTFTYEHLEETLFQNAASIRNFGVQFGISGKILN